MCTTLLAGRANPNVANLDSETPLLVAARRGYTGVVEVITPECVYIIRDVLNILDLCCTQGDVDCVHNSCSISVLHPIINSSCEQGVGCPKFVVAVCRLYWPEELLLKLQTGQALLP